MGGQSGEMDQSGLLEACFTLDGHFRQGSGESQGQKLRHAFQRRTRQSGKRNPTIQPCGSDKVVRVRSKATSDLCNTGATLASGHSHTFSTSQPDLFFMFHSDATSLVFFLTPHQMQLLSPMNYLRLFLSRLPYSLSQ